VLLLWLHLVLSALVLLLCVALLQLKTCRLAILRDHLATLKASGRRQR
jgi:hypothetical protein